MEKALLYFALFAMFLAIHNVTEILENALKFSSVVLIPVSQTRSASLVMTEINQNEPGQRISSRG